MTAVTGYTSDLTQGQMNATDLSRCFGGAPRNHAAPLISRRARETFVDTLSFEPGYMKFQLNYFKSLAKSLPVTLDPVTLLSPNGVYADWNKGLAVSGYMASPIGYAPRNNRGLRKNLGLAVEPTADFLRIVENVSSICFSEWREVDINVTDGSSAGWVGFRTDAEWKIAYVKDLFKPKRIELFLNLALQNRDVEFSNEFETVWAAYAQKRDGIDSPDKKRRVYGLKYANDPDKFPDDYQDTDKVVRDPRTGKLWSEHSATRERLINALPWAINAPVSVASSGTMKSMFDRFPDVFHVNTPEQVEGLINGNFTFFGDASEFDQSHTEKGIAAYHNGMAKWWDRRLVHVSARLFTVPYYCRPMSADPDSPASRPAWVGRPFREVNEVVCGNRSGHASTSLLNKIKMVAAYLYAIHLAGYEVIGHEESWMKGERIIRFINNGDDSIIYSRDAKALERVVEKFTNEKTAMYKITKEKGGVYNGMPTILVDAERLIYKCVPNALNGISKYITPERPIYHPRSPAQLKADLDSGKKIHRKYWYMGFGDKIANAYKNDVTDFVMTEFIGRWNAEMRDKMTITEMLDYARRVVPPLVGDFTAKDLQVLDDPDKLHHKFARSEIDPIILEACTSKVDSIVYIDFVKVAFGGKLIRKEDYLEAQRHLRH